MADVKISALPIASSIADADLLTIVQNKVNKKVSWFVAQQSLNISRHIFALPSSAGAGGSASAVMSVPGLLAGDLIIAVTQKVPGSNNLPIIGFNTQVDGFLTIQYSADPGAGAVILVSVAR